jgi:CheY-like chemotaxis protein
VRETIAAIFEELGFAVVAAGNAREALTVLADRDTALALLFTDVQMPGMSGTELAVEARKLRPEMKVIFTSGYTGKPLPLAPLVAKPFRRQLLSELVAKTLAR